jgi:hypothetical protein
MSPRPIRQLILTGTWAGEVSASVAAQHNYTADTYEQAANGTVREIEAHPGRRHQRAT